MVNDYEHCSREGNNWFPIYKDLEYGRIRVADYHLKRETAVALYGHTSAGSKKELHRKIICDNNLRFQPPTDYCVVALDIETYNEQNWTAVPLVDDANAHISMIAVAVQHISGDNIGPIQRHIFLYDRSYDLSQLNTSIVLHRYQTEQQTAMHAIMFLAGLKKTTLILTFNGSASTFDSGCGYDMPFIMRRSGLTLTTTTKIMKMDDDMVVKAQCLDLIEQLPNVYFLDLSVILPRCTSQDIKNNMNAFGLDDYLQAYGCDAKKYHDYIDLQHRTATPGSHISDIVEYCMWDAEALFSLDSAAGITTKMLALQEVMKTPLCYIVYQTDRNGLELYLQREYTQMGYAVSYYVSGNQNSGYKGAYCETVAVPCRVYSEVFSPDFASLYPSVMRSIYACLSNY